MNEPRKTAIVIVILLAIGMVAWTFAELRDIIGRWWLAVVAASMGALLILLTAHFAHAHDHEHPELNAWYQGLTSGKGPCCDGSDAVHLADPEWESHDGHYRVLMPKNPNITYDLEQNGEWVDVPDEAVVKGPNRDGRAMVWPMYEDGHPRARCFMPGALT